VVDTETRQEKWKRAWHKIHLAPYFFILNVLFLLAVEQVTSRVELLDEYA
jgi:hypothetical protein